MHVPEAMRERAFRILSNLLAPRGVLVISLRHGSDAAENRERDFHPVSVQELEQLCRRRALSVVAVTDKPDNQGRDHVRWQTVVMQLPDDGTGSSEVSEPPTESPD